VSFEVVVVPTARRDLETIVSWIAERSPRGAVRWIVQLERALSSLSNDPHRFASAPEAELASRDVRQVLFKTRSGRTYRALFDIDGSKVRVLRIRGPNQDLLDPHDF
jgi:plasmid stabilization system protein ParE